MEQKVYDNLLRKSTRTHELKIKGFCKKFVPYTSPHKSIISSERKKVYKHPTLKEFVTLFSALHLTQQQQRSRPRKTTCPLRDLVQGWPIPALILTPVMPKLHINLSQTIHTNNSTGKRPKISEKKCTLGHHVIIRLECFKMSRAKIECLNFKYFFELEEQLLNI